MRQLILSAPISVDINLTNVCNLSCDFCSATPFFHSSRSEELSLVEISKVFDELDRLGVFSVRLAGGEPLVRKDICDIISLTKNRYFESTILSNGLLINQDIASSMAFSGMTNISLSIDGHTSELHDAQRGKKGALKKTLSKISILNSSGINYSAMTTVTSQNVHHLTDIVLFLEEKGFRSVNFILLNYSGLANSSSQFASWQTWSISLTKLTLFLLEHPNLKISVSILPPHEDPVPYEISIPLINAGLHEALESVWGIVPSTNLENSDETGCAAGKTQLTIFENGDVFGCELMRDYDKFKAGNIRHQTIKEIWDHSEVFQKLRALKKQDLSGTCSTCPQDCGGGCRASAANMTKQFDGSDINCHTLRII